MSKKALDRIRKNIETREETLDLSKCKMTELPEELRQCVWLKELNFNKNKVSDLSLLSELLNLNNLYCADNQILDLSPLTNSLTLNVLYLKDNQIMDLSPLSNLSNLTRLVCWNNQITDLSVLSNLSNLTILGCQTNKITDLSPLSNLSKLNILYCGDNQIADLNVLADLPSLVTFFCWGNQITDLSPLSNLSNLSSLDCSDNQITDLSPLSNLSNLSSLSCWGNQITDLSPILFLIRNRLKIVYDPHKVINQLNNTFRDFSTSTKLEGKIDVSGCPITTPPIEIVKQGNDAIIRYFDQLHQAAPLNEVKILLVGEGAAGKTSLVKALCQDTFDKKESQTHGIRIRRLEQKIGVDKVKLHFWDFGGQEIMHATHQFFLSKRSIYLLVLDSRRDEKAEYWLKHIESFGGDSPILVILNKMDENPGFRVNERFLQERYPNIRGFYKVSCSKRKIGLKEFKESLEKEINALELRRTMFPKAWFEVKNEFDNTKKDYISGEQFRNICVKYQVADEVDQDILLRLLNDLGKVLHYDSLRLHNTEVLNPLWLTNGVYRVINSPIVVKQKGWFEESELEAIIEDDRYQKNNPDLLSNLKEFFSKAGKVDNYRFPRDKYAFLIGMMQEFELCYQLSDAKKGYIVPELLPVEEQSYTFSNHAAVLYFVFEYPEFLPTSIFPRLMVRLNDYIFEDRKWRTGMALYGGAVFDAIANVIADREAKRLIIKISGGMLVVFWHSSVSRFVQLMQVSKNSTGMNWSPCQIGIKWARKFL